MNEPILDDKIAGRWPLWMYKKDRTVTNAIEILSVILLTDDFYEITTKHDETIVLIHKEIFDYRQYGADRIYLPIPKDFIVYNNGRVLGCERKRFLAMCKKLTS